MSPTGASVIQQQALTHVQHRYLPVDFPGACSRFFRHTPIAQGWIVETEIWPWLFASAKSHGIPLTIISARLSSKTLSQADGWLSATFRQTLKNVRILARSEQDKQGFVELGASLDSSITVGNLKYTSSDDSGKSEPVQRLVAEPYVLAASTHADEEMLLAQAWNEQPALAAAGVRLVIVPRHPERGATIRKQLAAAGIASNLRSSTEQGEAQHAVLIADTLGELQAWYSSALACFVGGSLIERGGHNVLEAARAGCPIVVGPHTQNFRDIVSSMHDAQALQIAADATEVMSFFKQVIQTPDDFHGMRDRALSEASRQSNVLDDYLQLLLPNKN